MNPQTIIFVGPQGSGKGTQIDLLKTALKTADPKREVLDIQTGRRFRGMAAREETFTESHVASTIDTGALQPLFLSVSLWGDAMRERMHPDCHLLADGFPRTVSEARVLESAWTFYSRTELTVINLDTPEAVVRERMQSRARADDTNESIEARLQWYRDEVLPVVAYYREHASATVVDVDGTAAIESVQEKIQSALGITA